MASSIKKIILSITVTDTDHDHFVHICSDWALYCGSISHFEKLQIMKLLKYLVEERPKSKRLLNRCIGRFNRLNALKKEALE